MLHDVLLALFGHSSPLFEHSAAEGFPHISPAESALLANIGRLASLHRALRSHLSRISSYHPSTICRMVATSICKSHLSKLRDLIVDVERQILTKDPSSVGAYDIVPLASIVSQFEPWRRRLDWFWELACFMYPADAEPLTNVSVLPSTPVCTGPSVLNRLRSDSRTGYPDIEKTALALISCAEPVWLRQLATWLLDGVPPRNSNYDFFIQLGDTTSNAASSYTIVDDSIPMFVSPEAASSILFIGRTLGLLVSTSSSSNTSAESSAAMPTYKPQGAPINTSHLQDLARLQHPIAITEFSRLIAKLRSSVALQVVDEMLPVHLFINTLFLLRRFLLVGRVDFTDALIIEADAHVWSRHQNTQFISRAGVPGSLTGALMKEGEVGMVLAKTWSGLAMTISKEEAVDEEVEWAREHTSLVLLQPYTTARKGNKNPEINGSYTTLTPSHPSIFDDLLLSTPTTLLLRLDAAFDLFLGEQERKTYSSIHSYLLAIRRAHNHLSGAWRHAALRRDHPAPIRRGRAKKAFQVLRDQRSKRNTRLRALRAVWSSCNAGVVTLAELGEYLAGEVITQSWAAFSNWALQRHADEASNEENRLPRDPEVLAQGHRWFLAALVNTLLLHDGTYTKTVKSLCVHADILVALLTRLEDVQRNMDLQDEGVIMSTGAVQRNLEEEERDILGQLSDAAKALMDDLTRLTACLRDMSGEPPTALSGKSVEIGNAHPGSAIGFEPYRSRTGIDRLLLKLSFSAVGDLGFSE